MSKLSKIGVALGAVTVGALAAVAEVVVHGYLDVMYKETIPPTLIKKMATKNGTAGKDVFNEYNAKCNEWIAEQDVEIIDRVNPKGYNLKGYLLMAKEETKNFVVFAHGYRSSHRGDPANFEQYYHELGYNFLTTDHAAAGDSEGDYVGFDYFESDDMLDWIAYLVERFGDDIKIILHGVSMGGATVCQMASRVPSQVKFIVSDCAYTSAEDEFTKVASGAGVNKLTPFALKVINFLNKRLAGYDLAQTDVRESVINSNVPMIFVHGKVDDFVPVEMGYELYDICTVDKDLLIVDEAYHAQSIIYAPDEYKAKINAFIEKYI